MPATTRSANNQAKLEDVGAGTASSKTAKSKAASPSRKRKADAGSKTAVFKPPKKAKHSHNDNKVSDGSSGDVILINRAPVLELWSSCVAQFLHPSVPWETCLSVGGAIATITAISKGRSIGKIEKPDPRDAQKKREERKRKAEKESREELEVMSFTLNLDKDGQAMVGGKPKKAGEAALMKKYGGPKKYAVAKKTFQDALEQWKGRDEEINARAFKLYETFRPSVKPGQQGWGKKGHLNMQEIRDAVADG